MPTKIRPTGNTQRDVRGQISPYVTPRKQRKLRDDVKAAQELYDHELRAKIVAMRTRDGYDPQYIAERLGISTKKVLKYIDSAIHRFHLVRQVTPPLEVTKVKKKKKKNRLAKKGVVLPPARYADRKFQREAFHLRQRALPISEIAELLDCEESEADKAIRLYVQMLNESESNDIEIARRIQVEQIDRSIQAILPYSTGVDAEGNDHKLSFEAIDRLVKLMDAKAKLLGLNVPQRVDLRARLEIIAQEGKYDLAELEEIYQEVVQELPALTAGRS